MALTACAVALPVAWLTVLIHEFGHWIIGRCFGPTGRMGFFPRRGQSRLWFMSIMGVTYKDGHFESMNNWQCRLVAAGGPLLHWVALAMCLYAGAVMTGPTWLIHGLALAGVCFLPVSILNVIPLPIGNDGWVMLHPKSATIKDRQG
jgi:hypothetical protein